LLLFYSSGDIGILQLHDANWHFSTGQVTVLVMSESWDLWSLLVIIIINHK